MSLLRTVIIAGVTRRLATSIARSMIDYGWNVVIADPYHEVDQSLIAQLGPGVRMHHLDPTNCNDWHLLLSDAEHESGHVRALIIGVDQLEFGGVESTNPTDFRRIVQTPLMSAYLGVHVGAAFLRSHGQGTIVTLMSAAGVTASANLAAHTAAQWGVRGLTKAAALDLADSGIRVFGVCAAKIEGTDSGRPVARLIAVDRGLAVAEQIRDIITDASHTTGSEFVVDCGGGLDDQISYELPLVEHPMAAARAIGSDGTSHEPGVRT